MKIKYLFCVAVRKIWQAQ